LCYPPFRLKPLDLFDREIGWWLKPFGMQRAESGVEGRRHHAGKRHRTGRRVTEIHAHQDDLGWTAPPGDWYRAHDTTSTGAAVTI
jgi:hypothetical protein